ncbi:inhibitor of growth protein 5 [Planococcus citri]|uniref:inhibitor of growth protein 5 n=1 Tax=Planococcus citri TaxID=170843 RepID=UPI0031F97416
MLSLSNTDTNNCVIYLENYLDCVENLPDDLQRHLTRMRELDVSFQTFMRDIESLATQYNEAINDGKMEDTCRLLRKAQSILISAQELGDEKLQIVQQLQDLIESRTRSLDNDYKNIDNGSRERETVASASTPSVSSTSAAVSNTVTEVAYKEPVAVTSVSSSNGNGEQRQSKRVRRGRTENEPSSSNPDSSSNQQNQHHHHHHHHYEHGGSIPMPRATATLLVNQKKHAANNSIANNKKKKRKTKQNVGRISQKEDDSRNNKSNIDDDDDELSIDPDEPTYCLCDQISYGEMICCDNDLCPIEWFHFSCVSLSNKPKGKWFCPKCRGDRPNVMKPKAQFLKELERYNREKEEKARSY